MQVLHTHTVTMLRRKTVKELPVVTFTYWKLFHLLMEIVSLTYGKLFQQLHQPYQRMVQPM